MKELRLIKKIEDRANKFKLRALVSPNDGRRHDQVRPDEQKWMWIAHNQLGWSFAKIGSIFNRDPRIVNKAVQNFKHEKHINNQANLQDSLIVEAMRIHFSNLKDFAVGLRNHVGFRFDSPEEWFRTVSPEEHFTVSEDNLKVTYTTDRSGSLIWRMDQYGPYAWSPEEYNVLLECLKYHLPNEKLWQSFEELNQLLSYITEQATTPDLLLVKQAAAAAKVVSHELKLALTKGILPGKCPSCPS